VIAKRASGEIAESQERKVRRRLNRGRQRSNQTSKGEDIMKTTGASLLVVVAFLFGIAGFSTNAHGAEHFVPNDQSFWDNSENWTTDYGPA